MSDEAKEKDKPAFTVSDRRKRYDEEAPSEAQPSAPAESAPAEPKAAGPEEEPPEATAAPEPGGETPEERPGEALGAEEEAGAGPIGPADFVQLVGKLYEEALVFMGYHDDPRAGQSMRNLPVASWHIDVLELLRGKTKGNLNEEEAKLLDDAVANLKLLFVRASGVIKH